MGFFWRTWNLPVHSWMVAHVYLPLTKRKWSKQVSRRRPHDTARRDMRESGYTSAENGWRQAGRGGKRCLWSKEPATLCLCSQAASFMRWKQAEMTAGCEGRHRGGAGWCIAAVGGVACRYARRAACRGFLELDWTAARVTAGSALHGRHERRVSPA